MRKGVVVFLLCLTVYLADGRPHPEIDCVPAPYTAWSLVRHGSFDLRYYPELQRYVGTKLPIRVRPDGSWVSLWPPGSALAAVPFVAPFALLREQPLRDRDMHHLGKLAAAVSVAAAAVLFYIVCRSLAPVGAWPATILFGLGTCLYSVASQALWTHGPAVLWLCCALYFLTRTDGHDDVWRLAAGFSLGLAVLTRPTTAFFAISTAGALLVQRRWRGVMWLSLGGVIPAVALCWYNWANFGHPLLGAYGPEYLFGYSPLWWGLSGLLIAPSRGVLVYSPALLLVIPGAWTLVRRSDSSWNAARVLLLAWLIAAGVTLLFYARWHEWRGGWSYGPRYLCETMPILCLLFAIAYRELWIPWQRHVAIGLVVLSILVHLIGIAGYSGYEAWQHRHPLTDQGRSLFSLQDTQIEAHARAAVRKLTRLWQDNR